MNRLESDHLLCRTTDGALAPVLQVNPRGTGSFGIGHMVKKNLFTHFSFQLTHSKNWLGGSWIKIYYVFVSAEVARRLGMSRFCIYKWGNFVYSNRVKKKHIKHKLRFNLTHYGTNSHVSLKIKKEKIIYKCVYSYRTVWSLRPYILVNYYARNITVLFADWYFFTIRMLDNQN